jgi:hypothetical protein
LSSPIIKIVDDTEPDEHNEHENREGGEGNGDIETGHDG